FGGQGRRAQDAAKGLDAVEYAGGGGSVNGDPAPVGRYVQAVGFVVLPCTGFVDSQGNNVSGVVVSYFGSEVLLEFFGQERGFVFQTGGRFDRYFFPDGGHSAGFFPLFDRGEDVKRFQRDIQHEVLFLLVSYLPIGEGIIV